jgi:hypothetical protein
VPLPEPIPGLVIRYSYLWYSEHREGREEGQKDRPCAIIAAIRMDETGARRVLVLPVTHSPPQDPKLAVEIPRAAKERLRLDDERSWVVLSEWNDFVWPGLDLRPASGGDAGSVAYGVLPPGLFNSIRDQFLALVGKGRARHVPRTE